MPQDGLQNRIDARRKEIHTDGYPMSIGELARLYEDDELEIHPEFQRFFRWTLSQKSRLIESLLLGARNRQVFSDADIVHGLNQPRLDSEPLAATQSVVWQPAGPSTMWRPSSPLHPLTTTRLDSKGANRRTMRHMYAVRRC